MVLAAQYVERSAPDIEAGQPPPRCAANSNDLGALDGIAPTRMRITHGDDPHVSGSRLRTDEMAQCGNAPIGGIGAEAWHDQPNSHALSHDDQWLIGLCRLDTACSRR